MPHAEKQSSTILNYGFPNPNGTIVDKGDGARYQRVWADDVVIETTSYQDGIVKRVISTGDIDFKDGKIDTSQTRYNLRADSHITPMP